MRAASPMNFMSALSTAKPNPPRAKRLTRPDLADTVSEAFLLSPGMSKTTRSVPMGWGTSCAKEGSASIRRVQRIPDGPKAACA